jgi:iron complex outermembrane receptor protein
VPANCFLTGNGGNPFLNPLESDNYDAALEYYFSRAGFVSLTVFRRDLNGFIAGSVAQVTAPDGRPLRLGSPINSGAGRIEGFEIQGQAFFDFIGLPQVGVQANVTYLDASAEFTYDAGFDLNGVQQTRTTDSVLPGISDWSYNVVGIYEAGGLSVRLAYNWRSEFLLTYQDRGDHIYTEDADPVSRLDLSASYELFGNVTIFGDWTNILGDPFSSTLTRLDVGGALDGTVSTFPRIVRYEESTVSVGVRVLF